MKMDFWPVFRRAPPLKPGKRRGENGGPEDLAARPFGPAGKVLGPSQRVPEASEAVLPPSLMASDRPKMGSPPPICVLGKVPTGVSDPTGITYDQWEVW